MATDQSQPRNRLIAILAFGTVASLFVLKFVFDSYFIDMYESEAHAKLAKPEELWKIRDDENKRLTQSPTPIDQAMQQVGRGREASPLVTPEQSTDNAPLVGWGQLAAGHAGAAPAAGDGGATATAAGTTADGGTGVGSEDTASTNAGGPADAGKLLLDASTVRQNQGTFPGHGTVNPSNQNHGPTR
jgi:hypothetical protein